jgi:hypothetical protein
MQPPGKRRFGLDASGGDRDGERLPAGETSVRQDVPILKMLARPPAVDCRSATLFIFLAAYGALVFRAVSAFAQRSAAGLATRAKRKVHGNCPA